MTQITVTQQADGTFRVQTPAGTSHEVSVPTGFAASLGCGDVAPGELAGPHVSKLPWVRKERRLIGVSASAIELVPDGAGHRLQVGSAVSLRATRAAWTGSVTTFDLRSVR